MQRSTSDGDGTLKSFVTIHPLDPEDASAIIPITTAERFAKRRALERRRTYTIRRFDGARVAA